MPALLKHKTTKWIFLILLVAIFGAAWVWQATVHRLAAIDFQTESKLIPVASVPVVTHPETPLERLSAESVYVLDVNSGSRLFSKNENELRSPASTIKLVTALVASRLYGPQEIVVVGAERITQGNTVDFYDGQAVTVKDLLYALLVSSGNDAAEILAHYHPQGREAFIGEMNKLVAEMGLQESSFTNPSGLDGPGQYMSAHDLAVVLAAAMKDELIASVLQTESYQITDQQGRVQQYLWTTNTLLKSGEVIGGKTGTTEWAGEVLAVLTLVNDHPVVTVVMGSDDRYQDTHNLLTWIENSFEWQDPQQLGLGVAPEL